MKLATALGQVVRGYLAAFKTGAGLAIAVLLAGASSALVAWPLWLASTKSPRVYALSVLAIAAALVTVAAFRSRAAAKRAGAPRGERLGPARGLALLGCAAALVPALALVVRLPWIGVPLLLGLALAAGLALFARSTP
jgi:hypothetical protein